MTETDYYTTIKFLVPTYGEMPLDYKRQLTNMLRKNKRTKLEPATNDELCAIINYLNARCMEVDMVHGKMGYMRYKDAVLCMNYEHTGWLLLERRPEDQLWDLWNYMVNLEVDEQLNRDMSNIYSLK